MLREFASEAPNQSTAVLLFGPGLMQNSGATAHLCVTDAGVSCIEAVSNAVQRYGGVVNPQVLSWSTQTRPTPAFLQCTGVELAVNASGYEFFVAVLPHDGQSRCVGSPPPTLGRVDILIAHLDTSKPDGETMLLHAARVTGRTEIFASLPTFPTEAAAGRSWAVNSSLMQSYLDLQNRVIGDHLARGNVGFGSPLAGFYQSYESPITNESYWLEAYTHYDAAGQALHRLVPSMKLVISPYWSVRKPTGSSLEQSISGARHLATR